MVKCVPTTRREPQRVDLPACWVSIPYTPYEEEPLSVESSNITDLLAKLDLDGEDQEEDEKDVELEEDEQIDLGEKFKENLPHSLHQKVYD